MRMMLRADDYYVIGYIHTDRVDSAFHDSMLALIISRHDGHKAGILSTESGPYLAFSRNLIADRFMNNSEADWLLFLDSDMEFGPDIFSRLVKHADQKTIVGGLYMSFNRHNRDSAPMMSDMNLGLIRQWKKGELLEVGACATGAMLIHRKVFEAVPKPWFGYENDPPRGEDFFFCVKARQHGIRVVVDTSTVLGHCKSVIIGENDIPNERYF